MTKIDLKNTFCYITGLSIAIINRFRHKIIGYGPTKNITVRKIYKNIKYDYQVINNFEKRIQNIFGHEHSFKNKKILEIGPGTDLGTGLFLKARGAKIYTAVDPFKMLCANKKFYSQIIKFLENKIGVNKNFEELIKKIYLAIKNNQKEIKLPDFQYLNISAEKMATCLTIKYDIILSQAVLEHINNIGEAFKQMFDVLKNKGMICHEIDFKTHTRFIKNIDPLNLLRYNKKIYDNISFVGSPNRLRINDYCCLARNAGFTNIKIIILDKLNNKKIQIVKKSLAKPFCDYKTVNLQVLSAVLIAQKQ